MADLGVPDGFVAGTANAVDCAGSTIVGSLSLPAGYRAFRWTRAAGFQPYGDGGVTGLSEGVSVSADGATALVRSVQTKGSHYELWVNGTPSLVLGDYDDNVAMNADATVFSGNFPFGAGLSTGDDYTYSVVPVTDPLGVDAVSVSPEGRVFLGNVWSFGDAGTLDRGLLWSPGGAVRLLPEGRRPLALSTMGRVVVGRLDGVPSGDADFIWDDGHGARQLRSVLAAYGVTVPADVSLLEIDSISDDARVVAGVLVQNNDTARRHAFKATLPSAAFD